MSAFAGVALAAGAAFSAAAAVEFNREIRPIMSDTCFHCHGPDAKSRKGGLRLDIREEALKAGKSGAIAIVPGKPEESEVVARLFTEDEDDVMPPEEAHKPLTAEQRETFKRWIAEGAEYQDHWAYTALETPEVPKVPRAASQARRASEPIRNSIDSFIIEKLAAENIQPSPEASKRTLLRRVSLDLTGLPPTPDEVDAFLSDRSARAYERVVERLLNSKHYGERMAVWWLDVARFTDTVGYHGDQNQRIFPYRDYVIDAFNDNKPFDQFTVEQLAGDLLPNPTTEQLVATGFNRLNMMTREGGAQPGEYLAKYNAERVRTVATTFLGSTFGCAECHDHKFDPITQRDFYSMQAVFADVKQWGVYSDYRYTMNKELAGWSNEHPFPPEIQVDSPYLMERRDQLAKRIEAQMADVSRLMRASAEESKRFDAWRRDSEAFMAANRDGWNTPGPAVELVKGGKAVPDTNATVSAAGVVDLRAKIQKGVEHRLVLKPRAMRVAAVRLEAMIGDRSETELGNGSQRQGLKMAAVVRRADGKTEKLGFHLADADQKEPRYTDGFEVIGVLNGWKLPTGSVPTDPASVWLLDPPVTLSEGDSILVTMGGDTIVPFRLALSPFAGREPMTSGARAFKDLNREDVYFLSTHWQAEAWGEFKLLHEHLLECREGRAWTMVTKSAEPMPIRVLARGNWMDESGPVQSPATPRFLPGISAATGSRLTRLDFARWICSEQNPLTARTVMNRLWKQFFGTGLSAVVDDLGAQGEPPSHPELLDWLSADFRADWNLKRAVKQIVMSATYRQSSSLRPELTDVDPGNRLLASQNPRRLDAEFVRDNALFIAGRLNLDGIGGPSVKPYQPEDYYVNLQFPNRVYRADTDEEQWRRGLYMHWQRTFLHPMLANFDAPNRDECTANRNISNTPQQALTLLNDPTFVEAARLLAQDVGMQRARSIAERIDAIFVRALARPATPVESRSMQAFFESQRAHYRENVADAEKLIRVGLTPAAERDPSELAAWTSLCRVVLNLQETVTRY